MKEIDKSVGKHKDQKLASFVVFLTDKREELEPKVAELAKKEKIENIPLTIAESVAGPEKYKVDKNAEVTVIVYSKGETKANYSFAKGELNEKKIAEIVEALPKAIGAAK